MTRRLFLAAAVAAALSFLTGDLPAQEGGYTLNRLILWGEMGKPYPRFERDAETGAFTLLFPEPAPETGWEPVEARRLVMRGPAFLSADPISILRPRDPDPGWASTTTEASFDLNGDGAAEIVRARTVMIPDDRDPTDGAQRVLVEIREGDRVLFGDLLEGPGGDPVRVGSISAAELTGDAYPDMMVRLESRGRGGIAFYSQAPLRYAESPTRIIPGFSPTAFRSDRYGIFDLKRIPRDFFSRLPAGARPENPRCASSRPVPDKDGRGRCRYFFHTPYLGWIRECRVEFIPDRQLSSFELFFPSGVSALDPGQALEFLTPALGGGYRTEVREEGADRRHFWIWRGKGSTARLTALESGGKSRAISLRLERD